AVGYYRARASSEEALQLLTSAVEAVGAGARATFKARNALDERVYKDDLSVFLVVMDSQRVVARGSNLRLVARDLSALANRVGRPISAEDLTRVNAEGAIEFAYQWEHPITGEVETKHAFARRVGSYLVAVGYYKPEGEQAE